MTKHRFVSVTPIELEARAYLILDDSTISESERAKQLEALMREAPDGETRRRLIKFIKQQRRG